MDFGRAQAARRADRDGTARAQAPRVALLNARSTLLWSWLFVACASGTNEPDAAARADALPSDSGSTPADTGAAADSGFGDAGITPDSGASIDAALASDAGAMSLGPLDERGVSTLTGGDRSGDSDGVRGFAELNNPVNLIASGGMALVADFYSGRIVEVSATGTGRTLVRDPTFARPFGLAMTSPTTLWIQTDRDTTGAPVGALWRLDLPSGVPHEVIGAHGRNRGLTALPDGRLAMADQELGIIRLFDPATGRITVLAGTAGVLGYTDGSGLIARFDRPRDLEVSPRGTLLVVDTNNHCLREVTLAGVVTTYAGTNIPGAVDGPRADARFNLPLSLAIDADGNVYVGDGDNFVIRRIAPDGTVSTLAGSGIPGFADAIDPRQAKFRGLEGLDVSADGQYLLVADGARGMAEPFNRIRRVALR